MYLHTAASLSNSAQHNACMPEVVFMSEGVLMEKSVECQHIDLIAVSDVESLLPCSPCRLK
jgi:hypothetical protein